MESFDRLFAKPALAFDWTAAETASMAVVRAVASVLEADPLELTPIGAVVDPDALDGLFSARRRHDGRELTVAFEYAGYLVRLSDTGNGYLVAAG